MARVLQLLKQIYYGSTPGALRGPQALYAQAKKQKVKGVTLQKCKEFLASQSVYTRHKPARKNYSRNNIEATVPGDIVQIDIWDLQRFRPFNDYSYVLLTYDTFSKFLQGVPLVDRKPATVQKALDTLISEAPFEWRSIYWDKEGAFVSRLIQSFLKNKGIHNYTTKSVVKAPGVERSIRTLRTLLQRRMESTGSLKWPKLLVQIIASYNKRRHSTTKVSPEQLVAEPWTAIPTPNVESKKKKFVLPKVGSYVRLNRLRGMFDKEASSTWTEEVFKVVRHKTSTPIPLIYIEDLTGDKIQGGFYPEEYQVVKWDGKRQVDKVIKERKIQGKPREYLVSYRGWPPKFNAWTKQNPFK